MGYRDSTGWLSGFGAVSAVVFDCDGVLVDSEPASAAAWRAALEARGLHLGGDELAGWVGRTDGEIAEHYGAVLAVSPGVLRDEAAARLERLLAGGVTVFDDALAALKVFETRRLPVAVASNSPRRRLDLLLAAAGLRFPVSVASDEVQRPKPFPDVYLAVARRLGVEATSCLVLEDSPTGIAAAVAAGMRVLAVDRGVFERRDLAAARRVVPTLFPL